jgi:ribonuclease HII
MLRKSPRLALLTTTNKSTSNNNNATKYSTTRIIISSSSSSSNNPRKHHQRRKSTLTTSNKTTTNKKPKLFTRNETSTNTTSSPPLLLQKEKSLWSNGYKYVVGVDEAGRGPLAGPVVIAACTISSGVDLNSDANNLDIIIIDDSKKMTEEQRAIAFKKLTSTPGIYYSISIIDEKKIDQVNILQATFLGMDECVLQLQNQQKCDWILVDGPYLPPRVKTNLSNCSEAIKGGDAKVRCIAAASIIAKHTRDQIMMELHKKYPIYRFDSHKGYPVPLHVSILNQHGPSPVHRLSYAPVRKALENQQQSSTQNNNTTTTTIAVSNQTQRKKR